MKILLGLFLATIVLSQCGAAKTSSKKKVSRSKSKFHVKALVVVDTFNRPSEADEDRKCYFGNVINGATQKLASLNLSLTVDVLDYVAEEGIKKNSFLKFSYISTFEPDQIVNPTLTRKEFPEWMKRNGKVSSKYNVAILYTRYKMNSLDVSSSLGSMCAGELPVIIVTDRGLWSSSDATAHGLATSLGAKRDGDQNECSPEDMNIMTQWRTRVNGEKFENRLVFSECTKKYISDFLKKRTTAACLTKSEAKKVSFGKNCNYKYPGQRFPWEKQCINAIAWYSTPCIGAYNQDENICRVRHCYSRYTGSCEAMVPVDGTSCGDGKWCIKGNCVKGKGAPKYDGKCEDRHQSNNLLRTVDGQKTCSYIKNGFLGICEHDYFSQWCCKSCGKKN